MKVRIKKTSKKAYGGQQSDGALDVTPAAFGGADMKSAKEGREVQQSLTSVPRSKANLEAEGGETAFGPISGDTIPDHYKIKGPRHTNGGVPLNLPDDTFIFSDTKAMKITDPKILTMFGKKAKKGGYTPADLAKPYDINKYKGILMDPDTDRKERETAELMIKNYIMKLGALALAQESKKGFPQGIPEMAKPYMEANGITEDQLLPQEAQEGGAAEQPMMRNGGLKKFEGPGDSQVDLELPKPNKGENRSDWMARTTGNPGYARSTQIWDGTSWVEGDGSSNNQQKNPQSLNDVESYKNATDQQRALYESLTPEQRQMLIRTEGQQQKGQPARDVSGRIIQRDDYGGNYGQQRRYPNQRGNRFGFSDFNPFGQRAFTKDFEYLTPFKSPTFSGTNIPFTGQLPEGSNLTSISQTYKKNPFFKSLFNKDMARKEFTTRYNFNGAGSSTPSLAGNNNAISNFQVPQLDFNQSTQSGAGSQGLAGNVSNRQFARDFEGEGFGSARDIRKALRKGDMTQQEYLDLMNKKDTPAATPKPDNSAIPSWITDPIGSIQSGIGSSPAPTGTSNQNAIPSWITDPVGSATSGSATSGVSSLPVQSAGQLDLPAFGTPAIRRPNNNPANPISSRNAFATGALQGIKDQLAAFDKNQAAESNLYDDILNASPKERAELMAIDGITEEDLRRYQQSGLDAAVLSRNERIDRNNNSSNVSRSSKPTTTTTGTESAANLKNRLNQMRSNAEIKPEEPNQSFTGLSNNSLFDFSTNRSIPYQFGQNLKKVKIRRPANSTAVNDGRDMSFNPDYSDGFAYGGYAKNGVEVEDEGDNKRPAYNTLYPASETQSMNPNAGAGKDYDIYDPYFSKAYYGDGDIDRAEFEETGEEYVEDKSYVPRGMPAPKSKSKPKSKSTQTGGKKGGYYIDEDGIRRKDMSQDPHYKLMKDFPLHVFDLSASTMEMPSQEEIDMYDNSDKLGIMWAPAKGKYDEMNLHLAYANKNLEPRKQELYDFFNKKLKNLEQYVIDPADGKKMVNPDVMYLQVQRDKMIDKLEENYNKQYAFEDYELDYSGRPSGELTGAYTGQSFGKGPGYGGTGQGFKRAFGGENPILDMFVYGDNDEYWHGGTFHPPMKDYAKDFQTNTEQFKKLDNSFAQTADDPYVNPITGKSPAVVYNSETGGYDETNPEYAEGNNPFSVETTQKVNSAFTFRPDVFMNQAGALAGVVKNSADLTNQQLNQVDGLDIARDNIDSDSRESTFQGGDMANNMGQRKKLDNKGSNQHIFTRFGGVPMAMYGANMGGAYYPVMDNGGTKKVKILKTYEGDEGGSTVDNRPKTQQELQDELNKGADVKVIKKEQLPDGTVEITKSDGSVVYAKGSQGSTKTVESGLGKGKSSPKGTAPSSGWYDTICNELKRGVTPEQLEALDHGYADAIRKQFADCITEVKTDDSEFYEVEAEETVDKKTGKKECKCFKLDEQGNKTEEVISKTIVNEDEDCPVCEATVEVMRGPDPKDPGGYSDAELAARRAAQKVKTRQARRNPALTPYRDVATQLETPRTADVTAQGNQSVRAMQAAGMRPAQIVAALSGPMAQKNLAETGRRYAKVDSNNTTREGQTGVQRVAGQTATDRFNANQLNAANQFNARATNTEGQLENAKGAMELAAFVKAEDGERQRQNLNYELEDYQVDRNWRAYDRYNPKDPKPIKPEKDLLAQYIYNKEKLGADDADNALRIAQQQLKQRSVQYGGFIPRYTTMPYGN